MHADAARKKLGRVARSHPDDRPFPLGRCIPARSRFHASGAATLSPMDLKLLESTLVASEEPSLRAGQVWEWTARGAASYDEMTNLPAALRERLTDELPFSTL